MHSVQMVSATPYFLKTVTLQQLPQWEWCAEHTFQGWGGGKEPLITQSHLLGQLAVTSLGDLLHQQGSLALLLLQMENQ